jgi:PIN domain nuclease of toxin-antitoxin system
VRVLLDTQVALALMQASLAKRYPGIARLFDDSSISGFFSVASLWEIAIKTRLRKLDPGMELSDIAGYLAAVGIQILPIEVAHVTVTVEPEPGTRDPFDRLLLAQCVAENLKLATVDRALAQHPLALVL